jgi:hypothetical protein
MDQQRCIASPGIWSFVMYISCILFVHYNATKVPHSYLLVLTFQLSAAFHFPIVPAILYRLHPRDIFIRPVNVARARLAMMSKSLKKSSSASISLSLSLSALSVAAKTSKTGTREERLKPGASNRMRDGNTPTRA